MSDYMDGMRRALTRAGIMRRRRAQVRTAFVAGAGLGLLAGATAALLLTPVRGPEMRRELGARAKKLAEDAMSTTSGALRGKLAERWREHESMNEMPMG